MSQRPPSLGGRKPIAGHALSFYSNRIKLLREGHARLGRVFSLQLGPAPAVVMIGPDLHELFFTQTDKALRMDKAYKFLRAAFGEIAFTAGPEQYEAERHILHAPFKGKKMPAYAAVMDEEIEAWLETLGEEGELEIVESMTRLTQFVAAHALLGRKFRAETKERFWRLYEDISRSLDPILPPQLPLPKFRRRDRARAEMTRLLLPVIQNRRSGLTREDDFLQEFAELTLKDGSEVPDEKIIQYILGLIFAGHETTSGQASWAIVELLRHPAFLRGLQEEMDVVCTPGEPVTLETLGRLPRLEWAVREAERLHPVTDILIRYVNQSLDVGGYEVPAGWLALVSPAVAHRLPEIFANPHVYDPDRFGPGRAEDKQHKHALITFGGGTHKCTGMNFAYNEMMMIVLKLFTRFDIELLTPETEARYGVGASRPSPTWIRYRRRLRPAFRRLEPTAVSAACPHLQPMPLQ